MTIRVRGGWAVRVKVIGNGWFGCGAWSGWGGWRARGFDFVIELCIAVVGWIDTDTRLRRSPQQAIKRVLHKNQKQHGW